MAQSETAQQSRRHPLVLYVEDDDQTFESYSAELAKDRQLVRARTGVAALDWLEDREQTNDLPNLVVVPYRLPDMSGIELMAVLKLRYPEVLFMMLSNHHTEDVVIEAFRLGALQAILTTTLSPQQVARRLRTTLDRRGQVG